MEFFLKDGTGTGKLARIGSDNYIRTRAVIETEQKAQALIGKSYQIGSGVINITSASESAVLWAKNNEDANLMLTGVNITSKAFTGSSDVVSLAKVYLNGTGLSGGTSTSALNNNFGSSRSLSASIQYGGNAQTVTGGTAVGAFYIPINTFFNTDIAWVLPKGVSVGVSFTAGSGTTSWLMSITLEAVLLNVEDL